MEELNQTKKLMCALVLIFGLSGLILGFFSIRKNIYLAMILRPQKNKKPPATIELQNKDTDKDGISDYEEIYLYNTSPYLEDTDSDGINDKEEIQSGKNPLCPEGQDCLEVNNPLISPYSETIPLQPVLPVEKPKDFSQDLLKNLSLDKVRNALKKSGISEETLNKISDEELQKMLEETLKEMQSE